MALKDLVVDQGAIQEDLIERSVSPFIGYDVKEQVVVLKHETFSKLAIPQKIVVYLLALKGWKYLETAGEVLQDASPKEIAAALAENGSTIRSHLQVLLKRGLLYKTSSGYSVSSMGMHKISEFLK